MFRDGKFNLAVVFSTVWHLFCIFAIGIVVTPSVRSNNAYQEVDFLGPILEKTAFDLMVDQAIPKSETLYSSSVLLSESTYLKPRGPRRRIPEVPRPVVMSKRFGFIRDHGRDKKEIPRYIAENIKNFVSKPDKEQLLLAVAGPARKREIIFKPKALAIPRGLYGDQEDYRLELKFFVASNGIVYDATPAVSSGYPEIDLEAIRFLKRWRFSPLNVSEDNGGPAWGIVTVMVRTE